MAKVSASSIGPDIPAPGSIFGFRTSHLYGDPGAETGRFGALKVLGRDRSTLTVAALEGVWTRRPTFEETQNAPILRQQGLERTGQLAVWGIDIGWWREGDLRDLTFLGASAVSNDECTHAHAVETYAPGTHHSTPHAIGFAVEYEWRWQHDREVLIAEQQVVIAMLHKERAARDERFRTRLRGITFEQLLTEDPFAGWSPSPPYPSKEFTDAARQKIHDTCRELRDRGPKLRKADVRKILKQCVEWLNAADAAADGAIETEEREDLCQVLEEMAHAAKQKSLADEIDDWRSW